MSMSQSPTPHPRHRIGAVARLTGISTHALRAWERRYATLQPVRSEGGDRLYSDDDVLRLRQVKRLLGLGHAIGDLATLPVVELEKLLKLHATSAAPSADYAALMDRYLGHIARLDLASADQTLAAAAGVLPRREFIDQLLVPLMTEVGARWQDGSLEVAHEHAATAMVRSHLGAMLRLLAVDPRDPRAVATTLEGELQELGALMAAFVAALTGWRALFLGPSLPVAEISRAVREVGAEAALISCVSLDPRTAGPLLADLSAALPRRCALVVGGQSSRDIDELPGNAVRLADLSEFESWLARRSPLLARDGRALTR